MPQNATSTTQGCIFCAIVARQAEASVVYEDETALAFMSLHPVTPGHLLVVPRKHAVGLEDLDAPTSTHAWSVAHEMARAIRRSAMPCEGINVFLCDGGLPRRRLDHHSRRGRTREILARQRRPSHQGRPRMNIIFDAVSNDAVLSRRAASDADQARHWSNTLWRKLGRTSEL